MDKDYFLNSSIPPPPPPPSLEFQHTMPTWNPLSSEQPMDCFMNPNWDQHNHHFDSALTSMVISSTSAASDTFALRELIGKLGTISNSTNVVPPPFPAVTTAATPSCFTVQINSPPKLSAPRMDQIVNNSTRNSQPLPALSSDPGFAERAAKFSCLGSRSFNGRTSQLGFNNGELSYRSSSSLGKFPRVGSSPALKQDGSPLENKNLGQPQMDIRPNSGLVSGFDKSLSRLSVSGANSNEESSVSEQVPSGGEAGSNVKTAPSQLNSRKRKAISRGKAKEDAPNQAAETLKAAEADENANVKRSRPKTEGNGNENNGAKNEEMAKSNSNGGSGDENQKPPEPPKDYIHVRARRGQATDSHSLAERVRREKISERMKLLQDLVPGCNKVTGKALMLDEIINYVQALQRKVEFLSMKLASVNPRMDFDLDNLMSKDMFQPNASLPQPVYALDSSAVAMYGHQPQQTPQLHTNNTSSGSASQCQVDPLDASLCHNLGLQLPPLNGFGEGLPQFAALCEDDLQSIVQMGFSQNANADDLPYHSQGFPVADQASQMKVEL